MSPEFSRPVAAGTIPHAGSEMEIVADAAERAALARRLSLPGIGCLRCRFRLRPGLSGRIVAEGELQAVVTQVCVVSLDAFETDVAERFALHFVPEGTESAEIDPDEEADEIPYARGVIDLGEGAAEQLALALAPYPRKPGVEWPRGEFGPEGGEEQTTAFARLAAWKRRQ